MYNEQRKHAFIDHQADQGLQTYRYQRFFNKIAPAEERIGKDICEMTEEELTETMEVFNTPGVRGGSPMRSAMRNYARWSRDQGYPVSDACFSFQFSHEHIVDGSLVGGPAELSSLLTDLYGPVGGVTNDVVHAMLWLAYIGVPFSDCYHIESDEFDFRNNVVIHNGRYFSFPEEAIPSFVSVCTRNEFLFRRPNGGYMRKRADGNRVLRLYKDNVFDNDKYYNSLVLRQASDRSRVITYENVRVSGLYYKILQTDKNLTSKKVRTIIREVCLAQAMEQTRVAGKIVTEDGIRKNRLAMMKDFKNWLKSFHPVDYDVIFGGDMPEK